MRKGGLFFWCSILFVSILISVGVFQLLNTPDENQKLDENIEDSEIVEVLDDADDKVDDVVHPELELDPKHQSISADNILSHVSPATLERAKQNGIDLEKLRASSIGNISESDISQTLKELGYDIDVSKILKELGYESLDEYMDFLNKTPLPTDSNGNPIRPDNRTAAEREASIEKTKSDLKEALLWLQENPRSKPVTNKYDIAHRREFLKNFKDQLSSYFIFDETGRIVGETDLFKQLREMENSSSDESALTPSLEEPATPFGESIPSSQQKWSPDTFRTTTRSNLSQWGGNINRQYFDVIFTPYLTQEEFDTLYPTPADRQRLQQRQSALQSELAKHFRKLLSPNTENRSQKVKIIQELLRDDYGNDIADSVMKQLNE